MGSSQILIADNDTPRAKALRQTLAGEGFECAMVASAADITAPASALFVAGDDPDISTSDELTRAFAEVSPGMPIVVISESPLWKLIPIAVRARAWMDVPKTEQYRDLLQRYAISRKPGPRIVIESSKTQCEQLQSAWHNGNGTSNGNGNTSHSGPLLVHTVGDALEAAIDGWGPVLLNITTPSRKLQNPNLSTLIYRLCPAVIAVIIEAHSTSHSYPNFVLTEPTSRFAVIKPPFRSNDLKVLLKDLDVAWPVISPL